VRRFVPALVVFAAAGPLAGQQPVAPYRFGWGDAASVTAAGVAFFLPGALGLPRGAPSCAPCDPATLWQLDRWAVHPVSSGASAASSAGLAAIGGAALVFALHDVSPAQARGNAAVVANALGWTAASTEWLKVVVRRKRPVLFTGGATAAAGDPNNQESFPSGHTSIAFAAATSYAVLARREHLDHGTRNALLLYAGASGVGALRVAAGKHFPTDVVTGALLGSALGWLVARIHPTR